MAKNTDRAESTESIEYIETQLLELLKSDIKSWVKVYEYMRQVETEGLYKGKHKSYTSWVNDLASKSKVHVSLLWQRQKAGRYYYEYAQKASEVGISVPELETADVSPDNLALVEKIAGGNFEVAAQLMDKVLAKEMTRNDLKAAWRTVKESKEARKSRHEKQTLISSAGGRQDSPAPDMLKAGEAEKKENAVVAVSTITAADFIKALTITPEWVDCVRKETEERRQGFGYAKLKYALLPEFAVNSGTSHSARRIDALAVENRTTGTAYDIRLHGIEIKVSKSDLLNDTKMAEYTDFVDFFWIAVPSELIQEVESIALPHWGILTIDVADRTFKVQRKATQYKAIMREKTLMTALYKVM